MLIRIVDMLFTAEGCEPFLEVFNSSREKIAAFPGCLHLKLLRDKDNPCRMMTYSHWDKEESLENYRQSDLFRQTWAKTKIHFARKANAASFDCLFEAR